MELIINILKSVVFGIVQGITEWLPISSTGHLILVEKYLPLNVFADAASNTAFFDMYKVVIQFGSILAVLLLYWNKLWPFGQNLSQKKKNSVYRLWIKIIIATIPAMIVGLLLDDWIDSKMSTPVAIAVALIVYGIAFIWLERKEHTFTTTDIRRISYKNALKVGFFQCLALIPGTSRSGSTILGATILGFDRPTAAEFSFYMAIPVMFGASLLKIVKFIVKGVTVSASSVIVLLVGTVVSFAVSVVVIRYLMEYIRKHDFQVFGFYRIVLGILILVLTFAKLI